MRQPDALFQHWEGQTLEVLLEFLGVRQNYLEDYRAPRQAVANPEDLVTFPLEGYAHIRLTAACAQAAQAMILAAERDQITLYPISGYRTLAYQAMLIQRKLDRGDTLQNIMRVNALPGFSEHHTGDALDLGTNTGTDLEPAFEETRAFRWLSQNAGTHGFSLSYPHNNPDGFIYEPWHWRFSAA
jgi:D-alanyl-D-alanine carboxypeptidase